MLLNENKNETTRRNVVKGAAWSVPVIAAAVAAPAASASLAEACVNGPASVLALGWTSTGTLNSNWAGATTTGWIGMFSGSAGGDATENVTGLTSGFLSQDDNDSSTDPATVTMQVQVPVIDGATYTFNLDTAVGFGNPGGFDGSARQSMILDVVHPNSDSGTLLKLSVQHWNAVNISPTDSQAAVDGFVLQDQSSTVTRSLSFTAAGTGTAILQFQFTIQPKIGTNRADDIAVGIPTTLTQTCAK